MVLRLYRLKGQGDGAWCRPDLKDTSAFLRRASLQQKGKLAANARYLSMSAREGCSLLASTEDIPQLQQERIDRIV